MLDRFLEIFFGVLIGSILYHLYIGPLLFDSEKIEFLNYSELQAKYRNYVVIEKQANNDIYTIVVKNPITNDVDKVHIPKITYYNTVFVTDTIKQNINFKLHY